jgi:hypothetical protein
MRVLVRNSPAPRLHTPVPTDALPRDPKWLCMGHEIKHDGYRLIARRHGGRVRLYTRRGYDWSGKYLRIVEALRSLRIRSSSWIGKRFGLERTAIGLRQAAFQYCERNRISLSSSSRSRPITTWRTPSSGPFRGPHSNSLWINSRAQRHWEN